MEREREKKKRIDEKKIGWNKLMKDRVWIECRDKKSETSPPRAAIESLRELKSRSRKF